ncbi:hypothetical protein JTE90_002396 [Oedothorax gibbosus]|uniref:Uncharacterized protein n=1 Tax=Oedothorax gibbosus TaxID=931172 RepID=A0AAV6TQP7_9ARAC|nr:hypothetical protein JTE90_002396 [Oedothorax gibbosus]
MSATVSSLSHAQHHLTLTFNARFCGRIPMEDCHAADDRQSAYAYIRDLRNPLFVFLSSNNQEQNQDQSADS